MSASACELLPNVLLAGTPLQLYALTPVLNIVT